MSARWSREPAGAAAGRRRRAAVRDARDGSRVRAGAAGRERRGGRDPPAAHPPTTSTSPSRPTPSWSGATSRPGWPGSSRSTTTCGRRCAGRRSAATPSRAFRLAVALWWFWATGGHARAGRDLLAGLLARFKPSRRLAAADRRAGAGAPGRRPPGALPARPRGGAPAPPRGAAPLPPVGEAAEAEGALDALGRLAMLRDDHRAAHRYLQAALRLARARGDRMAGRRAADEPGEPHPRAGRARRRPLADRRGRRMRARGRPPRLAGRPPAQPRLAARGPGRLPGRPGDARAEPRAGAGVGGPADARAGAGEAWQRRDRPWRPRRRARLARGERRPAARARRLGGDRARARVARDPGGGSVPGRPRPCGWPPRPRRCARRSRPRSRPRPPSGSSAASPRRGPRSGGRRASEARAAGRALSLDDAIAEALLAADTGPPAAAAAREPTAGPAAS